MAHFYFVRHGETEWNKADRICGISESPLTELGRQQAAEAGEYIKAQGFRIDEILHSPLGRAKETASIISGITGIPMREEKRIREHNFGKFEGTSPKDSPDFILAKQNFANDFEGGESLFRVAQRVYNVLDEIMADETRVYLLVAHGGIFRFIRSYFENLTNEEFARSLIANCKVLRMGDPAPDKPLEHSLTWEVTDEMTAKRIGSAGSKILSTPNMVALMEACALELAKEYLSEGQTTVGAEVSCRHLAPTPVGMKVTATARLKKTERRKMWFDIEVHDEKGLCGKGSHLRVKVNSKAMKDKGAAKAQT